MINRQREEIRKLTSEIIELENDSKNAIKIKQNVQSVLNAVASFSGSDRNDLELLKIKADLIFTKIRLSTEIANHTTKPKRWGIFITHPLEDFCICANSWNPIQFDFSKRGFKIDLKNVNFGVNINK